jgi:hypothetical protein
MPRHTKDSAAAAATTKSRIIASAMDGGKSKRGAGGAVMGKAALRARRKNAGAITDYLDMIERVSDHEELDEAVRRTSLRLARVIKMLGYGHMDVQLQDGTAANLGIAKSISFAGRAASKSSRENCILAGDLVVVRDGKVAGKFPVAMIRDLSDEFARVGVATPPGFFTLGTECEEESVSWEFDHAAAAVAAAEEDDEEFSIDAI